MEDIVFTFTKLLCFVVFTMPFVEGYAAYCGMNQTIFVPEESTATFQTNSSYARYIKFIRRDISHLIFNAYLYKDNIIEDVRYYDHSWQNRTHISMQLYTDGQIGIRIDVSNINMEDNGTYELYHHESACFILFVMQIHSEPSGSGAIEVNTPVYVYAHPRPSVVKRPFANATMVWFLDGLSVNQTAHFVQQDGLIWMPRIPGGLNGKNVTYRVIQENGNVNEVNYTLNLMYGPSSPLTLVPGQTHYYLGSGDVMPDITCSADCKPQCSISWGQNSNDATLSLGAVTSKDTGEYKCTASRAGVKNVHQSVNIYVADNTSFTIAVACLASVQALTTLGLGLYCFLSLRRNKQSPCQTCFSNSVRKSPNQTTDDCQHSAAAENRGLEHYEELDSNTIQRNNVYEVPSEFGLETYENTRLSSVSTGSSGGTN